jgi:hypothetical protein
MARGDNEKARRLLPRGNSKKTKRARRVAACATNARKSQQKCGFLGAMFPGVQHWRARRSAHFFIFRVSICRTRQPFAVFFSSNEAAYPRVFR